MNRRSIILPIAIIPLTGLYVLISIGIILPIWLLNSVVVSIVIVVISEVIIISVVVLSISYGWEPGWVLGLKPIIIWEFFEIVPSLVLVVLLCRLKLC